VLEQGFHAHRAGRFGEALALYETVIEQEPSQVAHNLAGVVLCAIGRAADGEKHFRKAVDLDPSFADAIINLANCRKELGGLDEAEALYKRSIELRPDLPPAWSNLGLLYLQLAQFEAAVECFRHALSLDSTNANARNDLGVALLKLGLTAEAETEFRAVVSANPEHGAAWSSLGDVFQLRGLLHQAETCFRAALKLSPMDANVTNNLATVARKRRQFDVAKAYCDQVLRDNPQHIGALNNLGSLAAAQADYSRAETVYRAALRLDPRHPSTRFNLATTLLIRGQYEEGFRLYESRFDAFPARYPRSTPLARKLQSLPRWRGQPLPSQRLLVWAEQGLGDTVMMLRYLPELLNRGVDRVIVKCDRQLARMVESQGTADQVVTDDDEAAAIAFDAHVPMMSLPRLFGITRDSVPGAAAYLTVPPEIKAEWRAKLGIQTPTIGLAWAGSPVLQDDAVRSIPLRRFASLLDMPDVEFVSLQKGDRAADWRDPRGGSAIASCGDLLDTAGLISALDLIISVDTAVAHVAGALGKPVWLLNRFASEWRWGLSDEDTLWYPSMKIFREPRPDSWEDVIVQLEAELSSRNWRTQMNEANRVSWGASRAG
jgi:tetratricopeptide (TPR) repeat protein